MICPLCERKMIKVSDPGQLKFNWQDCDCGVMFTAAINGSVKDDQWNFEELFATTSEELKRLFKLRAFR